MLSNVKNDALADDERARWAQDGFVLRGLFGTDATRATAREIDETTQAR